MSKMLSSLLIAAGLALSVSASAEVAVSTATYNLGTLSAGDTDFAYTVGKGAFSDTVDFSLSGPANLSGGVAALDFSIGGKQTSAISNLALTVYNSSNVALGSGTNFALSALQPAGSYYAVISGTGTGSAGGIFGGTISASPVPEPSTWGMLVVGLGLLGYTATRRKA